MKLTAQGIFKSYKGRKVVNDISIEVNLQLNGILKFVPFLKILLLKKMDSVMSEFIICAELYAKSM